jgi:hypothetical protein
MILRCLPHSIHSLFFEWSNSKLNLVFITPSLFRRSSYFVKPPHRHLHLDFCLAFSHLLLCFIYFNIFL